MITPERLREIADDWSLGPSGKAMREAADRIETLEADIWLLHQEIKRLRQTSDTEVHLASTNAKLLAALEGLLTFDIVERPAFRAKPHGAPNSTARIFQDKLIALEDAARAAIAKARGEAAS